MKQLSSRTNAAPLARHLSAAIDACESYAIRAPLRFAALSVLALLAVSVVVLRISYETNDDVFMTMIVAGKGFCAQPDFHLLFSNVLVGQALKWLYTACPQFPWYGGYLLLTHYLAQVAILYCTLVTGANDDTSALKTDSPNSQSHESFRLRFVSYLLYFAIVELVLLNSLQFTSTAFLAGQAGIFLLCLAARQTEQPQFKRIASLCSAIAMIVVAGLIRPESLALACLVASPLLGLIVFNGSRRAIVLTLATAGVATLLVMAAVKYDRATYATDPAWRWFHAFNELRFKFNDYGWTSYTPETARIFSNVGWTKNDHDMLARWYFDDPNLYSESRMREVLDAYPWKTARLTFAYLLEIIRRPIQDRALWSVALVIPFMLVTMGGVYRARTAIVFCICAAVTLVITIGVNNKIPPLRLYYPLLTFPLAATLLFRGKSLPWVGLANLAGGLRGTLRNWSAQPRLSQTLVVMLVIGTSMGVYRQFNRSSRIERERKSLKSFVADASSQPQKLFVCWEAALPFELISPLDALSRWHDISLLNLTWTQRTPWSEEVKSRFSISDLAKALYERNDVVLIATESHRSLFEKFASEHFAANVKFVPERAVAKGVVAGRYQLLTSPSQSAMKQSVDPRR